MTDERILRLNELARKYKSGVARKTNYNICC